MKNLIKMMVAGMVLVILISSCQQVFTTNAYFWHETDMSTMTDAQKLSYAEDLLASGTTEELAAAFAEISGMLPDDLSTADPELLALAADLAIGSSGIGDAVSDAISSLSTGDTDGLSTDLLDSIDTANLSSAVELMQALDASGADVTPEQYTNAAAAQLLVVMDGVDDISDVPADDPGLVQAQEWAEAGGVDLSSMLGDLEIPE